MSMAVKFLHDVCIYVRDNVPNVSDSVVVDKDVYALDLDKGIKGKYYCLVMPKGMIGNPTSSRASYSSYAVSVYLFYFMLGNENWEDATGRFLEWSSKVYDRFHLNNLDGMVHVCKCDFEMSPAEFGDMSDRSIFGEIQCTVERYNVIL